MNASFLSEIYFYLKHLRLSTPANSPVACNPDCNDFTNGLIGLKRGLLASQLSQHCVFRGGGVFL